MSHTAAVVGIGVGVGEEETGAPAVILEAGDAWLPIFISADQAQSIQLALSGEHFERPLTHDLLAEMVGEFGGAIDRVRIDQLSNNTFFAKIDAEQYRDGERRELVFDARPSDAIAIALRLDCRIEISAGVIENAGRNPNEFDLHVED